MCVAQESPTLKGNNTTVESRLKLSLKGGTDVDVKGIQVAITGDAKLDAKAPMTTIGDALTTVKGQMVKIEGTLVKLG